VKAELEALADKQPSLAPVCQHLRDLTEAGFGDGFFARQLVEQIAGSVPASEANSWRARIATVLHDQPDRSENGKVDEGKHISAKAHRLRAKLTPAKRPSRRVA
jgi:hypothetical protein